MSDSKFRCSCRAKRIDPVISSSAPAAIDVHAERTYQFLCLKCEWSWCRVSVLDLFSGVVLRQLHSFNQTATRSHTKLQLIQLQYKANKNKTSSRVLVKPDAICIVFRSFAYSLDDVRKVWANQIARASLFSSLCKRSCEWNVASDRCSNDLHVQVYE